MLEGNVYIQDIASAHILHSVTWKNRQMSIKVAQKLFHQKKERFWQLYKNCLKMWAILGKIIDAKGFKKLLKVQ